MSIDAYPKTFEVLHDANGHYVRYSYPEYGIVRESRRTPSRARAEMWAAQAKCHGMGHYEIDCYRCEPNLQATGV